VKHLAAIGFSRRSLLREVSYVVFVLKRMIILDKDPWSPRAEYCHVSISTQLALLMKTGPDRGTELLH
jgi:hypothetical protein